MSKGQTRFARSLLAVRAGTMTFEQFLRSERLYLCRMVTSWTRTLPPQLGEDDLLQEAAVVIYDCIQKYDVSKCPAIDSYVRERIVFKWKNMLSWAHRRRVHEELFVKMQIVEHRVVEVLHDDESVTYEAVSEPNQYEIEERQDSLVRVRKLLAGLSARPANAVVGVCRIQPRAVLVQQFFGDYDRPQKQYLRAIASATKLVERFDTHAQQEIDFNGTSDEQRIPLRPIRKSCRSHAGERVARLAVGE